MRLGEIEPNPRDTRCSWRHLYGRIFWLQIHGGTNWTGGSPHRDQVPVRGVAERELFAYGGCGPAVSTSHLTPSIGEIALPHGKLMNVLRVQGHTLGYELTTGINNEISASQ